MNERQGNGHRRKSKGYVIVTTALAAAVLFPMIGLAIDVGILYVVRAQLWLAADAAAMAGARGLGSATDSATQTANAQAAATTYFNANWPNHYWKSGTPTGPSAQVIPGTNIRTVQITASVPVPLYFLRIIGQNTATVAVSAAATRQDAFIIVVMDRSSSMNYKMASGQTACQEAVAAAQAFVSNFTEGRDYIGFVTFSAGVYSYPATTTFNTKDKNGNTIPSLINQIACTGNTATASGLNAAYTLMQQAYNAGLSAGRQNIIVLMTDGRPNGVDANYKPFASGSCAKNTLIGTFAQWSGGPNLTGTTAGILNHTSSSPSASDVTISAPNCSFNGNNPTSGHNDINALPTADIYGNYTTSNAAGGYTSYTSQNPNYPWNSSEPVLSGSPGGTNSPLNIIMASTNAVDYQGDVIRSDTTLKPQIYAIAVIGTLASDPPDPILLQKMANDGFDLTNATAAKFAKAQANQTHGYYVPAPDPTQITAAFQQVAAQIGMRLAQ
jgi:Flp pilus assembly protein TadG